MAEQEYLIKVNGPTNTDKFWTIWREGTELVLNYGRNGTEGTIRALECASVADAQTEMKRRVDKKLAEGYLRDFTHAVYDLSAVKIHEDQRRELIDMCADIIAHADADREVNIGGKGINASEASRVAKEVLAILKVDERRLASQIAKKVAELYDEEDDESDSD